MMSESESASKQDARSAIGVPQDAVLLSVASRNVGTPALYRLVHKLAPKLLQEVPHLHIHHETGAYGSVLDASASNDASDTEEMSDVEAVTRSLQTPKPQFVAPRAAPTSSKRGKQSTEDDVSEQHSAPVVQTDDPHMVSHRYQEVLAFEQRQLQLAASDVVLTRASALACAEAMNAGAATVLLPERLADDSHQYFNAVAMDASGSGAVAPAIVTPLDDERDAKEKAETAERKERKMAEFMMGLLADAGKRQELAAAAQKAARPDAARVAAQAILELAAEPRSSSIASLEPYRIQRTSGASTPTTNASVNENAEKSVKEAAPAT